MNSIQITLVIMFLLLLFQWAIIYYGNKRFCSDPLNTMLLLDFIKLLLGLFVLIDIAFLIIVMFIHLIHSL